MSLISADYTRLIATSEATYGTDAVATILTTNTSDIIYQEVASPSIIPEIIPVEINRSRGSSAGNAHGVIKNKCAVSARVPLLGRGAGENSPYYSPFLKAMGLKETIDDGDAIYAPATVQQAGMTMYLYHVNLEDANSRLQVATGVRGSGTIELALDAEAAIAFDGVGKYGELSAPAAFFNATTGASALLKDGTTPTTARTSGDEFYSDLAPMICTGITLTVDGVAFPVSSMNLSLNWAVDEVRTITGSESLQKALLTRTNEGSRVSGELTLLDGAAAFNKALALYRAGSQVVASAVMANATTTVTLAIPKLQIGNIAPSAQGGYLGWTLPFFCNGDWSELQDNHEFTLTYAAVV